MIFFGHIGASIGAVYLANRRLGYQSDMRLIAVAAIAPDLIDKPIAVLYPEVFGNHTRLFGHSLLFTFCVFAALLLLDRKPLRDALTVWFVLLGHFALDMMWKEKHALLWPWLGLAPQLSLKPWQFWALSVRGWYSIAGEIVGIAILYKLWTKLRGGSARSSRQGLS